MKVVIFGSSGMVGQGVLRECSNDDAVTGRAWMSEKDCTRITHDFMMAAATKLASPSITNINAAA